jgi:penicillin amidase
LMLVQALSEGLAFLSNPEKVGVAQAGGFGTDDMNQWRWGLLHTVTLKHNVIHVHDMPSSKDQPDGHPRHGDNYVVDVSNPGLEGTNFTYRHGPSIRSIYELTDTPQAWSVIPGGQHESPFNAHYKDEMAHWVENAPPPVPFALEDVLAARESMVDLFPAPVAD